MPTTTNYIWDEANYLAETDGTNTINVVYTNYPQQYGDLVSTRIGNTTAYHHFDAIGSTRQLTNAAGHITDTAVYDAWGNPIARTGSTRVSLLWIGQLGYYSDIETGAYIARARPYSPAIARWVLVDPSGFADGPNRYCYVQNDPIDRFDPTGRKACQPTARGVNPILTRGTFLSALGPLSPDEGFFARSRVGSDFTLRFRWARDAFSPEGPGSCCCCLIGFIQIATGVFSYDSGFGFESPWQIDGTIPYSFKGQTDPRVRATGRPCRDNLDADLTYIEMADSPNAPEFQYVFYGGGGRTHLEFESQEFETCVVCLGGGPGTRGGQPEGVVSNGTAVPIQGITSYGCVEWSFYARWNGSAYVYDRYLPGRHKRSVGDTAVLPLRPTTPSKPSARWWDLVRTHFSITGPTP
jgi:RHS repeat-associated protein